MIPWRREWAAHSSILAWRIPWTEECGGLQSMGSQRVRHFLATNTHTHTHTSIVSCIQFHKAIFKHNLCTFSATYSFSQPFIILIPVQFPEISIFLIRGKNFCDIHNHICLAHYLCTIILTTYFPLTDTL